MAEEPPTRARLAVPSWLWGGNPKRLLAESDYHFGTDRSGSFFVQPQESYHRRRPDLVRLRTIARPSEGVAELGGTGDP